MKPLLTALTLLILVAAPVKAEELVGIRGVIVSDCGSWLDSRKSEEYGDKLSPNYYEVALVAFLSGVTFAGKDFWRMKDEVTNDQIYYWMDNYCRENSLKDLADGALELFNERTAN